MKSSHAWAPSALISLSIAVYFVFSQRHSAPPPAFAALELAHADFNDTGSCYSLHNVLVANKLDVPTDGTSVSWTMRVKDEWHLHITRDGFWREFWFVRDGDRVLPMQYVVADGAPDMPRQQATDELVAAPALRTLPKLVRCDVAR
jgi:hypothetical protein